ncbi:MAG: hypothetical protein ACJASY_003998, partial [Halioglobus sp.]
GLALKAIAQAYLINKYVIICHATTPGGGRAQPYIVDSSISMNLFT